jgi:hypothetical protein
MNNPTRDLDEVTSMLEEALSILERRAKTEALRAARGDPQVAAKNIIAAQDRAARVRASLTQDEKERFRAELIELAAEAVAMESAGVAGLPGPYARVFELLLLSSP